MSEEIFGLEEEIFGLEEEDSDAEETKIVFLRLKAAIALAKKDIFGASDPYVNIELINARDNTTVGKTARTKTKKKTLYPIWDETFRIRANPRLHKLQLNVYDENRVTRDDFLGKVTLNLQSLETGHRKPFKLSLHKLQVRSSKSKVKGHLQLHVCFESPSPISIIGGQSSSTSNLEQNGNGEPGSAISLSPVTDFEGLEDITTHATNFDDVESMDRTGHPDPMSEVDALDTSEMENFMQCLTLPSGWEERTDTNGRTVYVNHQTRRMQFQNPQLTQAICNVSTDSNEEAEEAEFRNRTHVSVDEGENEEDVGGGYTDEVIDHLSSQTESLGSLSSSLPTSSTASSSSRRDIDSNDSEAELPPNWEARKSRTGKTFYINHATRTTQWSRPPPVRSPLESYSTSIPRAMLASNDSRRSSNNSSHSPSEEDEEDNQEDEEREERTSRASSLPTSEGLPCGWCKKTAPNLRVFYVNHLSKTTTWKHPVTGEPSPIPGMRSSFVDKDGVKKIEGLGPLPAGWEERTHKDGRSFFIDHNTRTTQWEDPRFSESTVSGQAIPYSRDYKVKYDKLRLMLAKQLVQKDFKIRVRRRNIFEDSFHRIMHAGNRPLLKGKLDIEFDNERGLDYGGLTREFFYLLSKEMFNPYYGFFEYSATDNYTLQINPHSGTANEDHLQYFEFFGRVAGMAVFHGKLLDAFFIRPFYKMLLGKRISMDDMESVDAEYFNSMVWIRDNDPKDLELTFQVEEEKFGETNSVELKAGGSEITVTDENKAEYINLVVRWRFVSRVREQMSAFKRGFAELVPLSAIQIFDEGEMELLLGGIGAIDVKDWKANTEYKGEYYENHKVILWFWKLVLSMTNEMRARLLQFVTGTSRVPMNGFRELYGSNGPRKFCIQMLGTPDSYPRSHTCFNRIDLPPYQSYEQLVKMVIGAIEGAEGFGGVD